MAEPTHPPPQQPPADVNMESEQTDVSKTNLERKDLERGSLEKVAPSTALTTGVFEDLSTLPPPPPLPYHVYSRHEKWVIVGLVAVTVLYNPLPANINFPALPTLAQVFQISTETWLYNELDRDRLPA